MERYKNWMSFNRDPEFRIYFNAKVDQPLPTYREALLNNAQIMRDSYVGQFDVLLSGGIDSEVVVRAFRDLGIKHNTFIFRLENDYNVRDVTAAKNLCTELDISYKIIDFDLQNFFEKDALPLFQSCPIARAARLPRLKWLEYLDNIPISCDGEPYWKRLAGADYTQKSEWRLILSEEAYSCSIYAQSIGRTAICDWYEYTPEIILSYNNIPLIQQLLNDELVGKVSSWSSRTSIHRDIWPSVAERPKLVGYEGAVGIPGSYCPGIISEFQDAYMKDITYKEYSYSLEDLRSLLLC